MAIRRAAPAGPQFRTSRARTGQWAGPYALLLPSLAVLLLFTVWPMVLAAWNSLFRMNLATPVPRFTGLGNYAVLFADPVFWKVVGNTLIFAACTAFPSIALALALALLLNNKVQTSWLGRTAVFYPALLPAVSAASIWLFMYTPTYGLMTRFLTYFGLPNTVNALGDARWAMPAIILMSIWKQAGFYMVFYLAALQGLPSDVHEAALVEGASAWQEFRRITFPLLGPTTLFLSMNGILSGLQLADPLYIMTKGGPDNATSTIIFYLYQKAFGSWNQGVASALSVLLIVMFLAIGLFHYGYLDKKVHY